MNTVFDAVPDNPYLLLTPGPLSTTKGVRYAMLRDWCTWDPDYNEDIVQNIRRRLTALAAKNADGYTAVLMQGSGSFSVEATLGSAIPPDGKLLVITNGAYGKRMARMAAALNLPYTEYALAETEAPDPEEIARRLKDDSALTHVAVVHLETTTGILNPLEALARAVKNAGRLLIVDAMSSFGGIPLDADDLGIDFLISSSNKCLQGVPGFGFVIARRTELEKCRGNARSYSLDLYDQWREMDAGGKWRFTSPTHVVRAFYRALDELEAEGGIEARYRRYTENRRLLTAGMAELGFDALLPKRLQSPVITSFLYPNADFDFTGFYSRVKERGFVLYPGRISQADTFRVGTIGDVHAADIIRLLDVIRDVNTA
ncbi:MAG: 2-aminoethylphosphonate--pyruvate transaminase [Clostridiales Family XIII bacterium]|jgi:2-aminoethylphosphonate-pyruvate transaminase|nr:2-aminoethylphosphonate--pyruvate transaminase [Clostridiales Family XIII bacterium]